MGCCSSIPKTPNQHPNRQNPLKIQQSPEPKSNSAAHEMDRRSPPPLPVEEETVKEVLSETPISKPQVSVLEEQRKTQMNAIEIEPLVDNDESFGKAKPESVVEKPEEEVSEMASQLSEICSVSESFSTTTSVAEKREDEATSKRLNRPLSSNAPRKRPYTVDTAGGRERRAKSPARRPEPSPEKKTKKIQVRGRESGQVATRKVNVGPMGVRRDSGERSGRRSRSPSTRPVSAVGGGRSQVKPPPAKGVEEKRGSEKVLEKNDDVSEEVQESLENPHVSMECFIFL